MLNQNTLTGPKGHFLLGNLQEFRNDPLNFLSQCAQVYSEKEIVPLRLLHLPAYLLLNPAHIEYVLGTQSQDFGKSRVYKLAAGLFGNGLLVSEGDFWLRQRRLMQPAFHRERIAAYGQIMVDYAEQMLSGWQPGQTLDIHQEMTRLSMGIVTKALFNCSVEDDSEGIGEALEVVIKALAARFKNPIPIPENIPTPGNRRYKNGLRRLDEVIYKIIQQRRDKRQDAGDWLSMLLEARDEDGTGMTDPQLRDETLTTFAAGFETSAVALSWGWYLLSQHPEVEAKLLAELDAVLGGRTPTVADLPKLPYTEMVFMEILRLYPPAPFMGREAKKDFEIGGHRFSKGTEFWIVPWVIHRNARYYDAPEEFRPERWKDDLAKRLPKFAYFPFSGGPRICIGNAFASMEVKLVLATLAQKFHFKLAPGQVVEPEYALSLRPKYPIKMILVPRSPAAQAMLPGAASVSVPV